MSSVVIPTFSAPFYEQTTRLEGREYRLQFRYSQSTDRWWLNILEEDLTPLVQGIKLVTGADLFRPYSYNPAMPPGKLLVFPQGADDSPPGLNDLAEGGRCMLIYVEAS